MQESEEMLHLCGRVREYLLSGKYKECREEISYAMYLHPDTPEPHNLMGLLLEGQDDHAGAMKHFRASYALDPTYQPARDNMMDYARFDLHKPIPRYSYADCEDRDDIA